MTMRYPREIFRAYDIRGVVGETLTASLVKEVGRVLGMMAKEVGEKAVVVARDGRTSGCELLKALSEGIMSVGMNVIDIGKVPTPLLYFATHQLASTSGVMVTGSHNPPEYNGIKMVIGGRSLSGGEIQTIYERLGKTALAKAPGTLCQEDVRSMYIDRIVSDVKLAKPLRVVVDAGNGVAGGIAPKLFKQMGCDVYPLFCEVDGTFPNHHPDPSEPHNLVDLIQVVAKEGADIGLAFDGDGDRLGVVTPKGKIIWPDRQLMLYAQDVLSRNPGATILYDVKSSRHIADIVSENGGKPLMTRTGHSFVKGKMKETGALLGGEMSGHVFFKERWFGFDDGLYTAARLLEILAKSQENADMIFDRIPESMSTPELKIAIPEERKFAFMDDFISRANFHNGEVNAMDGLRVDFQHGWGLVRASNTAPYLVCRFEADSEEALDEVKNIFRLAMWAVDESLALPF